jgi:hypothetical protein
MRMAFVSNGRRADRTINLPQAFDMFDETLAGPVSKHGREKEISQHSIFGRRYRDIAGLCHGGPAACAKSPGRRAGL